MKKLIITAMLIVSFNAHAQIDYIRVPTEQVGTYLLAALKFYNVKHYKIVYAQAILETGYFKSNVCLKYNNLFGLYNSNKGRYFRFNTWVESIEGYLKYIQYRYNPPEDYYMFLDRIGYAQDPEYINKLRLIVKKYEIHN